MGLEDIRNLLTEARRAMVEWRKELPAHKNQADSSRRLALFKELIAATDELLKQQDEFAGRLRRSSSLPGPLDGETPISDSDPPSTSGDVSMNAH